VIAFDDVLVSILVLGGVATVFGIFISVANHVFRVWEDPRIEGVKDLLPGADCGACGRAGCRAFAMAVIAGKARPAECPVMAEEDREEVASLLGVDAGEADRQVARLLCAGGRDVAPYKGSYHGIESCAAAVAVTGGGKACSWGCLGYADCAVSCDFDAITMSDVGLPVVNPPKCTACGDCVEACPLDLFVILPEDAHLLVQCKNLLQGDAAEAVCSVACNACGRCAMDAEAGLIRMVDGLAVVNYDRIELENPRAIERCPTGAIVWVEGEQFPRLQPAASEAA
jgi:Na+-translocating ferredoxin:NAD+ oxidoreductase RNF subunit RnfB